MKNLVLCGFMGAGKTTVGQEISNILNRQFIDTDVLIEQNQNITISEIFKLYGEEYFRDLEYDTCKKISQKDNMIISTGGGVLIFDRNTKILKKNGIIIYLDVPFDEIVKRIGNEENRPLFTNIDNAKKLYKKREEKYKNSADLVINGVGKIENVSKRIIEAYLNFVRGEN